MFGVEIGVAGVVGAAIAGRISLSSPDPSPSDDDSAAQVTEKVLAKATASLEGAVQECEQGRSFASEGAMHQAIESYGFALAALSDEPILAVQAAAGGVGEVQVEEKRCDPDTGKAYTLRELLRDYRYIYGEALIQDYWNNSMRPPEQNSVSLRERMVEFIAEVAKEEMVILKSLGACQHKAGKFREAVQAADQALAMDSECRTTLYLRARALHGAAVQDLVCALRLGAKSMFTNILSEEEVDQSGYAPLRDGPLEASSTGSLRLRLVLTYMAAVLSSGIWPGAAMFIKLFVDSGVLSSACQGDGVMQACHTQKTLIVNLITTLAYVLYGASYVVGLLFDRWGSRKVAVLGATLQVIGYAMITIACFGAATGHDAETWWLFVLGIFGVDTGSTFTSYGLFGFIWHFPKQQIFIQSLTLSSIQAGASLPLLVNVMMWATGWSLGAVFGSITALVALSVIIFWTTIPSQKDYYRAAKEALGVPLKPPPKTLEVCTVTRKAIEVLSHHTIAHIVCVLACGGGLFYSAMYTANASEFGQLLFGEASAGEDLALMQSSLALLSGLIVVPFLGIAADRFGLVSLHSCNVLMLFAAVVSTPWPSWIAQAVACLVSGTTISTIVTFQQMYCLYHAPPNRLGTVQGIMLALTIFPGLLELVACNLWIEALGRDFSAWIIPFVSLSMVSILAMVLLWVLLCAWGLPELPVLLKEDEVEISESFGCTSLEEVLEVTGLSSRHALLKKLRSTDPGEVLELARNLDTRKLKAVAARRLASSSKQSVQKR